MSSRQGDLHEHGVVARSAFIVIFPQRTRRMDYAGPTSGQEA